MEIFLFFLAAIAGGTMNALAGGGGLITFTLLLMVVSPVAADATSAVALVAGYPAAVWRTREELREAVKSSWLWLLVAPAVLGGLSGALLLSWSGNRGFLAAVPWLVLGATLLILLRPVLTSKKRRDGLRPDFAPRAWPIAMGAMFLVAVYGGFFGAGIGILVIGALGLMGLGDVRRAVAVKNLITGCMRGVAVLTLIADGSVNWAYGLPMAVGGLIGGYLGGLISHRANRNVVRTLIVLIGFTVAGYYFWRLYGPLEMHVISD